MANYSPFPINFAEANKYADLVGAKSDLEWIIAAVAKYPKLSIRDHITKEAFTFAVLIKYGRVFARGVRKPIPKRLISRLPINFQKDHEEFIELRNKYIAHSVNDFEGNYAEVYVRNPTSESPEFDQISCLHTWIACISVKEMNRLSSLSQKIIEEIDKEIAIEKLKIKEIIRKIPISELMKHKYDKDFFSNKVNVSKARSRNIIK